MTNTFDDLKALDNPQNVRKALEYVAFIAPHDDSDPIENLMAAPGEIMDLLDAGYLPIGLQVVDGASSETNVETDETKAHGYATPVREDVTEATTTVSIQLFEVFQDHIYAVTTGQSLAEVEAAKNENGERKRTRPTLPKSTEWRLLLIAKDAAREALWAEFYPRVVATNLPSKPWTQAALQVQIDFKALEPVVDFEVDLKGSDAP